jgi:hypothetical protein
MSRRFVLSIVAGYAAWTWASMAHVFLGLPDLGPVVGPTLFAAILLAPLARQSTQSRTRRADEAGVRSWKSGAKPST